MKNILSFILKEILFLVLIGLFFSCSQNKNYIKKKSLNGLWYTFKKDERYGYVYKEILFLNDSVLYSDENFPNSSFDMYKIDKDTLLIFINGQLNNNYKPKIYLNDSSLIIKNNSIVDTFKRFTLYKFDSDSLIRNGYNLFSYRNNFWRRRKSIILTKKLKIDTSILLPEPFEDDDSLIRVYP